MQPSQSLSSKTAAKEKEKTREVIKKIVIESFYSVIALQLTAILRKNNIED